MRPVVLLHRSLLPWSNRLWSRILAVAVGLGALCTPTSRAETVILPAATSEGGTNVRVLTTERTAWRPYFGGFRWVDDTIAVEGSQPDGFQGALYVLRLNQEKPEPFWVTAESRAEGVSGASDIHYSLYLDITFQDGTPLYGQTGNFSTGTHDWERRSVLVAPSKPVREVRIYALFRHHTGKAWFRNVRFVPLGTAPFDGIPVEDLQAAPAWPGRAVGRVATGDGFAFDLDAQGRLTLTSQPGGGQLGGSPPEAGTRPDPPPSFGGFLVRDALSGSGFVAGDGHVVAREGNTLTYDIAYHTLGLRLEATWKPLPDAIRVEGRIIDLRSQDRGVTVVLALPIDAVGGLWWDDIRRARAIEPGQTYANVTRIGSGANGFMSRYPLGAVTTPDGAGFALAVPPGTPRLVRLGYDAPRRWLYAAVDLGLSPDSRTPGEATFALDIYRFAAPWGFREAFRRYQERYPAAFSRRIPKSGIWMAFAPISSVRDAADFGFQFHEGPAPAELPRSRAAGVYTFRYIEPQSYWMPMQPGQDRSYAGILAALAEKDHSPRRYDVENAQATRTSGVFDASGQFVTWSVDMPWNSGALFILNPDPALPGQVTKAQLNYAPGATREADYHGLYIDSIEGWGTTKNFRRDHFRTATSPLVFDTDTGKVCLLEFFSIYDFARFAADDLHAHDKWLMANSTPWNFPYFLPLLDVAGTEINWLPGGQWRPDPDELMSLRRTLSGPKPYLLLMNTDFQRFGPYVERYFQRSLFYGFLPSMFSENASENHYFQNPAWYERDRPLFQRYIPLIRQLADAGWQIIPAARPDRPDVGVERFGRGPRQYWTLFDFRQPTGESGKEEPLTLAVDLEEAGLAAGEAAGNSLVVTDLLTGQPVPADRAGRQLRIRLRLAPEQVAAIEVRIEHPQAGAPGAS